MFGWEFPPYISGGLGTACYGMTRSLAQMGNDIVFVLPHAGGSSEHSSHLEILGVNQLEERTGKRFTDGNMRFLKVNSPLRPYMGETTYCGEQQRQNLTNNPDFLRMSGNYGPNLIEEVNRYGSVGGYLGKCEEFEVIHAHDWMTFPAGIEARKTSHKPLIAHVHATEFDRSGTDVDPDIYRIERQGMHEADKVITVSNWTAKKVIEHYGVSPRKISVVHNGVTKDPHLSREEAEKHLREKIVLFLGRITMQKGPEYFVEAARLVLNELDNVRFVMAGSGDLLPAMIEHTARLRMQRKFHFTGFLHGHRREQIYAMSDLFVMPSVSEPFGLTPVEAMQYDVPVIVSKQSGVAEVLEHATKVDFWDVNSLAEKMIELLTNQDLAANAVSCCRAELAAVDWDLAANRITDIYATMAS